MMRDVKSLSSLISMEKEKLNNLRMKLSEQKEIIQIFVQETESKKEILKQDLRQKMTLYKNNIDSILKNRMQELKNLKHQEENQHQALTMKLEIYEKRYSILYEKLKDLELVQAHCMNLYKTRLENLKNLSKKINIINQSLNNINHVNIDITFNYVVNCVLEQGLMFDNNDYDYFEFKLETT